MNSETILTIGGSGLIGSRVSELLSKNYKFTNESRTTRFDITNKEQVFQKIHASPAQIVILYAAKADVEGCEKDRKTIAS